MARHAGFAKLDHAAMKAKQLSALGEGADRPDLVPQRMCAARERWVEDPEAAAREQQRRAAAFLANCRAKLAAGEGLSDYEARMVAAYGKLAPAEAPAA